MQYYETMNLAQREKKIRNAVAGSSRLEGYKKAANKCKSGFIPLKSTQKLKTTA